MDKKNDKVSPTTKPNLDKEKSGFFAKPSYTLRPLTIEDLRPYYAGPEACARAIREGKLKG